MEGREPTAQRESKCAGNYKCVINTWEKWEGLNSRSEELRENCIGESADNSLGGCVYQEKKEWRMMAVWECLVRNQLLQKVGGKQLLLARKKKEKDAHQFKSSGGSMVRLSPGGGSLVLWKHVSCSPFLHSSPWGRVCSFQDSLGNLAWPKTWHWFWNPLLFSVHFLPPFHPHLQRDTQFMRTIVGHAALQWSTLWLMERQRKRKRRMREKMDNVGLKEKEYSQTTLIKSLCFFASLNFSLSKMMNMGLCPRLQWWMANLLIILL